MKTISLLINLIITLMLIILAGFYGVYFLTPDVAWLINENPKTTAFIEYRKTQAAESGNTYEVKKYWRSIHNIPRAFRQAVIFNEDGMFYKHDGFDWYELNQAVDGFINEDKKLRGASTITQQLAKNLFLSPDRSYLRKIREYWITRALEEKLSKKRILELYLNVAEWGPGVFGCQAGARYWYKKSINQLRIDEMTAMASILPSPLRWSPKNPNKLVALKSRRAEKYLELIGLSEEPLAGLARPLDSDSADTKVSEEMRAIRELVDRLVRDSILP